MKQLTLILFLLIYYVAAFSNQGKLTVPKAPWEVNPIVPIDIDKIINLLWVLHPGSKFYSNVFQLYPFDSTEVSMANATVFKEYTYFDGPFLNLTLDTNTFKKGCSVHGNVKEIHSSRNKYNGYFSIGESDSDDHHSVEIARFVNDSFFDKFQIYNTSCKVIDIDGAYFSDKLDIENADIQSLTLKNVVTGSVTLQKLHSIRYINIDNADGIESGIDLSFIGADSICLLDISPYELDKLNFDYSHFTLYMDTVNKLNMISLYERLLRNQDINKYDFGYAKADTELRDYRLKYFPKPQDKFAKIWWNYGYNKEKIFMWTAKFFLVFFGINLLLFSYLNEKIYILDKLKARMKLESWNKVPWYRFFWYRFWLSLIYSSIIFFGIKLDVDKMKFTNVFLAIYIYTFYALGLVCLVFIGNYFLFK